MTIPTPAANGGGASAPVQTTQPQRKPIASPPDPAKDPSDAIVEAAETLLRAASTRIAYHETQLRRLREALAPFAAAAVQEPLKSIPGDDSDVFHKLLSIAQNLEGQEGR